MKDKTILCFLLTASLLFAVCIPGVGFSADYPTDGIQLQSAFPEVQATYLEEMPVVDGKVAFQKEFPWVPMPYIRWETGEATVSGWFRLNWTDEGLYVAAVFPEARLNRLVNTGRTPDAPFELNMNLDVQPEPKPGAPGNFVLQFIPLIEAPSKMIYESHPVKFNHYLGSGSRLNDPGLVLWHELSLSHIEPEGVRTRWARREGEQGLSFEAFISWQNVGLNKAPEQPGAFFDLEVNLPGQPWTSWAGNLNKQRSSGGHLKLLAPGEEGNIKQYWSETVLLQTRGNIVMQQKELTAVWPSSEHSIKDLTLFLVTGDGEMVNHTEMVAESSADIMKAGMLLPEVPDGTYSLQLRQGKSGEIITEKPVYIVGTLIEKKIRSQRNRLLNALKDLINRDGAAWWNGYLAKARWLLKRAKMKVPASVERLNATLEMIDEVDHILTILAEGDRPDPAGISYYRPGEFVADGQRGPINIIPTNGKARLRVDVEDQPEWQVNPLIYGTFSEPVIYDRPIYGLLYAQRLRNSSFEWGHPAFNSTINQFTSRYEEIDPESARQVREGEWVTVLSTDEDKVAAPWIGIGNGEAEFSLHSDAYNSRTSQKIATGNNSAEAGVAQLISLPVWRESRYRFKGHFRSDIPDQTVKLKLYYKGKVIDRHTFRGIGEEWKQVETTLETPREQELQNGFLLSVTFDGPGTLFVDQLTLFPADSVGGMDPQIIERIRNLNTEWIRWPGGNYASAYHWKQGVGPFKERFSKPNPSWPGLSSHFFGTDEYMRLNREADLEPLITVNAGNGTAEEAADWVEYANGSLSTPMGQWRAENGHPAPYDVKYWNIGNELWGSWQVGYCTPADYVNRYRTFTAAMDQRDPDLTYIAIGVGPFSLGPKIWTDMLVDSVRTNLDVIDFHTYVGVPDRPEIDGLESLRTLIGIPVAFEQGLMTFRQEAIAKGREDLKVIVGEYNSSTRNILSGWRETAQLLSYAGWLHTFIRQGKYVMGANATEYSVFDPRAEATGTLHPRLDLFRLYNKMIGTQPVRTTLETPVRQSPHRFGKDVTPIFNLPLIDAVVLRNSDDGSLGIGILNRNITDEQQVEIELRNFTPGAEGQRYVFKAENPRDGRGQIEIHKDTVRVDKRLTLTLPPHSVSLIKLYEQ